MDPHTVYSHMQYTVDTVCSGHSGCSGHSVQWIQYIVDAVPLESPLCNSYTTLYFRRFFIDDHCNESKLLHLKKSVNGTGHH